MDSGLHLSGLCVVSSGRTPTQQRLLDAIRDALADDGQWVRLRGSIDGLTIRYTERDLTTPELAMKRGIYGGPPQWPNPTYDRHIFLTVIPGQKWSILLTLARAPWVGNRDQGITFKRAFEVLADPAGVFSD